MLFILKFLSLAVLFNKVVFNIPKTLRKVNIIVVRIFKSCDLIPKRIHLIKTVFLYIVNILILINSLAVYEKRLEKLTGGEVVDVLALPGVVRVENLIIMTVINRFILKSDNVASALPDSLS